MATNMRGLALYFLALIGSRVVAVRAEERVKPLHFVIHQSTADNSTDGGTAPAQVDTTADVVEGHARSAAESAASAKVASDVANKVAVHSIDITSHAQAALKHARDALHVARVDSQGLSADQAESLRKAEEKLQAATKKADYGKLKDAKYAKEAIEKSKVEGKSSAESEQATEDLDASTSTKSREEARLEKLQAKLEQAKLDKKVSEQQKISEELRVLREQLAAKRLDETRSDRTQVVDDAGTASTADDVSAEEMEKQLKELEAMVKKKAESGEAGEGKSADEIKAEMERLRSGITRLKGKEPADTNEICADLKNNAEKQHQVDKDIKALQAFHDAGKAPPPGSPSEQELQGLQQTLRAEEAQLLDKLGGNPAEICPDYQLVPPPYPELPEDKDKEYGAMKYTVGRKKAKTEEDLRDEKEEPSYDLSDKLAERRRQKSRYAGSDDDDVKVIYDDDGKVQKGFDIDTEMPYGELEPFGREDTAQELTEASIHESDQMVDQIERAEVAEEKRSVFRALTRLRGAAITSYDGVARSQTGNIDEYNKVHKWRKTHPLHHLADEESDISKWAFPDNADF